MVSLKYAEPATWEMYEKVKIGYGGTTSAAGTANWSAAASFLIVLFLAVVLDL